MLECLICSEERHTYSPKCCFRSQSNNIICLQCAKKCEFCPFCRNPNLSLNGIADIILKRKGNPKEIIEFFIINISTCLLRTNVYFSILSFLIELNIGFQYLFNRSNNNSNNTLIYFFILIKIIFLFDENENKFIRLYIFSCELLRILRLIEFDFDFSSERELMDTLYCILAALCCSPVLYLIEVETSDFWLLSLVMFADFIIIDFFSNESVAREFDKKIILIAFIVCVRTMSLIPYILYGESILSMISIVSLINYMTILNYTFTPFESRDNVFLIDSNED